MPPRPYHHGDLPAAMKRAALEIVEADGLDAVTMAAAARRAGVSVGAPYRHFSSLEDLLVATAVDGYRCFRDRQGEALAAHTEPTDALLAIIADFFAFAAEEPGYFALMWGSGFTRRSRRLDDYARGDYTTVLGLLAKITGVAPAECHELAMAIAGVVIGQARIAFDRYSPVSTAADAPVIAERGVRMLLAGFRQLRS